MRLELSLWENSQSFFQESITKALLGETEPIAWKFATFNLVQAIELAVKERLRRAHPLFVFETIDKPKKSVTLDLGIARLKSILEVDLVASDAAALKRAQVWRNEIVHADVKVGTDQLKIAFATLFGFYVSFAKRHLDSDVQTVLPPSLLGEAVKISEYADELTARAAAEFANDKIDPEWVWLCRGCGLLTFVVQDDTCLCYLCGRKEAIMHCGHCGNPYYQDELEVVAIPDHRGGEVIDLLCFSCAETAKIAQYEEE